MMKRTCEWTGRVFEGPAVLIPTTEGREVVDPAALRAVVDVAGQMPGLIDTVENLQREVLNLQRAQVDGDQGPGDAGDQAPAKKTAAARKGGKS